MKANNPAYGKLYLLPAPLGEGILHPLPENTLQIMRQLDYFIVERAKTARHYLKAAAHPTPLPNIEMVELNEHTTAADWRNYLDPILKGRNIGLLSEAGCPGVADPGAPIVALAHQMGIEVVPLTGPSSILLALMASGMNGQQFAFVGYIPAKRDELPAAIKHLEQVVNRTGQTQIFIEAPYRNNPLLQTLISTLAPETRLCVAADITLPTQWIRTLRISDWTKFPKPELHKRPVVFLIGK